MSGFVMQPMSRQKSRLVDKWAIERYGMSSLVLMENAGRNAAESIARNVGQDPSILILAGTGNNGGDGFVIARHWELRFGHRAAIVIASEKRSLDECRFSHDASVNLGILLRSGFEVKTWAQDAEEARERIASAMIIADAMLGTGASGPLREPIAEIVRHANSARGRRIAIDIPTGLDCDSGQAQSPCFLSDHTLTFVAPKIGFFSNDGPRTVGQIEVISIGAPAKLLAEINAT